jgi:NAD(P)-dependent dehydrogenase (short-subunit alcohol dehydrogenase family)
MSDTLLTQLSPGSRAMIVGASGGLGSALTQRLAVEPAIDTVYALSRTPIEPPAGHVMTWQADVMTESDIQLSMERACKDAPLELVIVATGALHGDGLKAEKDWRELDPERLTQAFALNAVAPAMVAKHALPALSKEGFRCFAALSARIGSIGDNRKGGWYGYRASKAALNQFIKTFSLELERKNPGALCVGLHPGTVDTGLSKPFQRFVPEGQLFSPDYAAERLLTVINALSPEDNGRCLAWDGKVIPP